MSNFIISDEIIKPHLCFLLLYFFLDDFLFITKNYLTLNVLSKFDYKDKINFYVKIFHLK
jgi:hypothetical protein